MEMERARPNGEQPAHSEISQQTARRPVSGFEDWGPVIEPAPDAESDSEDLSSSFDTGLVVDDVIEVDDDYAGHDDGQGRGVMGYAKSTYPGVHPAHRVERPYQNGEVDDGTIDSSRTLYAEEVELVTENGREYIGDYFQPVDQTEQTRQYVMHQVYLKLFDLELTTVPLADPTYILDIGTGVGEWAVGIAEKYPDCEVFGTDIAPIQPTHQVPFNVEFHIENAEDEWIRPADTVDLVHLRNMSGAISDWSFVYRQAYSCIRPGGWIEIMDFDDYHADNNFSSFFPPESPMHVLERGIQEAAQKCGRPFGIEHMKPSLLEEAGFVDVGEAVHELGIGPRQNSSYGNFWLFCFVTGIEAFCLRLLTSVVGWEAETVRDLCTKAAQETRELAENPAKDGFAVKLRVLTARKPLASERVGPRQWSTAKSLNENGEINDYSGGDDSTIGSRSGRTLRSEDMI